MRLEDKIDIVYSPVKYEYARELYKTALHTVWTAGHDFDASIDAFAYAHALGMRRESVGIALVLLLPGRMGVSAILQFLSAQAVSLEVRGFFELQMFSENVHAEIICRCVYDIIVDLDEQQELFETVGASPAFCRMKEWIANWIVKCEGGDVSFGEGIVVQAISRGLLRCSVRELLSFPGVLFGLEGLKNILAVLGFANDSYVRFACRLIGDLDVRPSRGVVLDIIRDAVLVEKDIVTDMFSLWDIGVAHSTMYRYIEYKADILLQLLAFPPYFNADNPFSSASRGIPQCVAYRESSDDHQGLFKVVRYSFDEDGSSMTEPGVFVFN